jgi:hypothetical protein
MLKIPIFIFLFTGKNRPVLYLQEITGGLLIPDRTGPYVRARLIVDRKAYSIRLYNYRWPLIERGIQYASTITAYCSLLTIKLLTNSYLCASQKN